VEFFIFELTLRNKSSYKKFETSFAQPYMSQDVCLICVHDYVCNQTHFAHSIIVLFTGKVNSRGTRVPSYQARGGPCHTQPRTRLRSQQGV
jgi:hypothetical protein